MKIANDIYILIPVYNEEKVVGNTIQELGKFFNKILVINDGSTDRSQEIIQDYDVTLINHPINLGVGASIKTGIEYILEYTDAESIITFDADGQHNVKDALNFAKKIEKINEEIIFGSRFLGYQNNIPISKRLLLRIAVFITNFLYSMNLTDTHNGLKAIKRSCLKKLEIEIQGYAYETEMIINISKKNISYIELPTDIKYTQYSKNKGQSIFNSIKIFEQILMRTFKK